MTTADATAVVLEHRENCLCSKAARQLPPEMWDGDRVMAGAPLLSRSLLEFIAERFAVEGPIPEPIGPDTRVLSCDALMLFRAYNGLLTVVERLTAEQATRDTAA